jgi:hypothetical protein
MSTHARPDRRATALIAAGIAVLAGLVFTGILLAAHVIGGHSTAPTPYQQGYAVGLQHPSLAGIAFCYGARPGNDSTGTWIEGCLDGRDYETDYQTTYAYLTNNPHAGPLLSPPSRSMVQSLGGTKAFCRKLFDDLPGNYPACVAALKHLRLGDVS